MRSVEVLRVKAAALYLVGPETAAAATMATGPTTNRRSRGPRRKSPESQRPLGRGLKKRRVSERERASSPVSALL